jgi:hypothetical protein
MTGQILPFPAASPPLRRRRQTARRPAERDDAGRRDDTTLSAPARFAPSDAGSSVTRLRPRPSAAPSTQDLPPCA